MASCFSPLRFQVPTLTLHSSLLRSSKALSVFYSQANRPLIHHGLHSARMVKSAVAAELQQRSSPQHNHHVVGHLTRSTDSYPALSCLPFSILLRSIVITTLTSYPSLLKPSLSLLSAIAYSKSPWLLPSRNPIVSYILKKTLFSQFCAGESPAEVKATVSRLKAWGIQGILLGYAREVENRDSNNGETAVRGIESAKDKREIEEWVRGTLQTINLTEKGDFVSIKLTGAGQLNRAGLALALPPSPTMAEGLANVCKRARASGVTIILDAEQAAVQPGIEAWTLALAREHNLPDWSTVGKNALGATQHPPIMGTYQAYLKATPVRLSSDLAKASEGNFTLGIKLVRGAYLGSDPRELIHDSKHDTDAAYDALAEAVLRMKWTKFISPPASSLEGSKKEMPVFPAVSLVLATHNAQSASRVMALRQELLQDDKANAKRVPLVYAQLMGMADHVSCELIAHGRVPEEVGSLKCHGKQGPYQEEPNREKVEDLIRNCEAPRPFKYLVWGSVDECLQYLVRRAEENRDAAARTVDERKMLLRELRRRVKLWI